MGGVYVCCWGAIDRLSLFLAYSSTTVKKRAVRGINAGVAYVLRTCCVHVAYMLYI